MGIQAVGNATWMMSDTCDDHLVTHTEPHRDDGMVMGWDEMNSLAALSYR